MKNLRTKLSYALYILLAAFTFSCTNPEGAKKALLDAGYTNVKTGGYDPFACGENDFYATKFSATSPNGKRKVTGCVCQGVLKGKTIRLD